EVLGEAVDALGEERHLHLRGAGVVARTLVLSYDQRLLRDLQCHATVSLSLATIEFLEPAILTDAPAPSQGFSMFISRLSEPAGESHGLQHALGMRLAQADHRAVGAVEGAQPFVQPADFQRLPVAQARLRGG